MAFLNKSLAYYNQDVDAANRGVGRLHKPEHHMLWNVGFLSEEEKTNPDYKQLIDNLRTYGLLPYFLSKEYHETAAKELAKVDWSKQPQAIKKRYNMPLSILRIRNRFLTMGSAVKTKLKHLI